MLPAWWMCFDTCEPSQSPCLVHRTRATCEDSVKTQMSFYKIRKPSPGDSCKNWPAQGVYHGRVIANHVKLHFSFISWDHLIFGSKSTVVQFDFGKRCSQKKCHLDFQFLSRLLDIKTLAVLSPTVSSVGHLKKLKCLQMQINFEIPQTLSRRFSSWTA